MTPRLRATRAGIAASQPNCRPFGPATAVNAVNAMRDKRRRTGAAAAHPEPDARG